MRLEMSLAALGPAQRQFHGLPDARWIGGMLGALIERHDNVGAESDLGIHCALGSEDMLRAVEMGAKRDTVLSDFAEFTEAEDLKSTGVGKNGARPRHETVQSAELAHLLNSRT